VLVFLLNIFWPHFWSTLFRIMFWPLLLEAMFFLAEAVFAYAWYYSWDWAGKMDRRKRVHLVFGWMAAASSLIAMVMIDIVGSYMLTPTALEFAWERIFNPTMIHLDLHRIFGNLTWTGFGLAGLCAIALLRAKEDTEREFYRWGASYCFIFGFGALLLMPVIGYQYLLQIRHAQPQAFQTLMLGERSWLFDLVALVYGLLLVLGSWYIYRLVCATSDRTTSARSFLPISLTVMVLAAMVFAMPYHIQHIPFARLVTLREINPIGKMQPNKYFALAFLVTFGFVNFIYYLKAFAKGIQTKRKASNAGTALLIALSVCSIVIMLTMGWSRETARAANGYLIYGKFKLSDEAATYRSPQH